MSHTALDPVASRHDRSGASGTIRSTLLKLFTRTAGITDVRALSPRFRLITLALDNALLAKWAPGDKLQLTVAGLSTRTFTPFVRDWSPGQMLLLGHTGGSGPGSDWLTQAQAGATCHILGPRGSLKLSELDRPTLFIGDETSFALALAMRATPRQWQGVRFLFEVTDLVESRQVLRQLQIPNAELIEREAGERHLVDVIDLMLQAHAAQAQTEFVLSGKSTSLQQLTRALKSRGVPASQVRVKAFWAPGKRGLD